MGGKKIGPALKLMGETEQVQLSMGCGAQQGTGTQDSGTCSSLLPQPPELAICSFSVILLQQYYLQGEVQSEVPCSGWCLFLMLPPTNTDPRLHWVPQTYVALGTPSFGDHSGPDEHRTSSEASRRLSPPKKGLE